MLKMPNVKIFETIVFWMQILCSPEPGRNYVYCFIVTIDYWTKLDLVYFTMEQVLKYCSGLIVDIVVGFILVKIRQTNFDD